jgi:probable rRNA maturation factor
MAAALSAALQPDVVIESPLWDAEPQAEATVRAAVAGAAAALPQGVRGELAIMLGDDAAIRVLNRDWRGQDKATNVLSFPAPADVPGGELPFLGDIAIAYETLAREAGDEGKPVLHHLAHLVIHGVLHLLGYDHESDEEAETMEGLERTILARLDIPDPYAVHDAEHERHA